MKLILIEEISEVKYQEFHACIECITFQPIK
jgi:hypothetical protein